MKILTFMLFTFTSNGKEMKYLEPIRFLIFNFSLNRLITIIRSNQEFEFLKL